MIGSNAETAAVVTVLVIFFECIGLRISIAGRKWGILAYYTQLSNLIALVSSLLYLVAAGTKAVTLLRFLTVSVLTMTFLITVFVLVPMGGSAKKLLFSGNGLYHHVICPILSVGSYFLWEQRVGSPWAILLPVALTLVYGLTMVTLNGLRKYDGPYPFFRVHRQSGLATVIWLLVLLTVIGSISTALYFA